MKDGQDKEGKEQVIARWKRCRESQVYKWGKARYISHVKVGSVRQVRFETSKGKEYDLNKVGGEGAVSPMPWIF